MSIQRGRLASFSGLPTRIFVLLGICNEFFKDTQACFQMTYFLELIFLRIVEAKGLTGSIVQCSRIQKKKIIKILVLGLKTQMIR